MEFHSNIPIGFRPRFPGRPKSFSTNQSFGEDILLSWMKVFPESPVAAVDEEDWIENAIILHHIVSTHPTRLALVAPGGHLVSWQTGETIADGEEVFFLGVYEGFESFQDPLLRRYIILNARPDALATVMNYAKSPVFCSAAARKIVLCRTDNLVEVMTDFVLAGIKSLFIKVNRQKYAIFRLDFSHITSTSKAVVSEAVSEIFYREDDLCCACMHLEGFEDVFIVQESVQMECEYRMIIINHKPVAGAGCIEHFSPLHNKLTFDRQMEVARNSGHLIEDVAQMTSYLWFADEFSKRWQAKNPEAGNYTLDLAFLPKKMQVCAIELNPLLNFGMYALKYEKVYAAITTN